MAHSKSIFNKVIETIKKLDLNENGKKGGGSDPALIQLVQ